MQNETQINHPFQFTQDWFTNNIPMWTNLLGSSAGAPDLNFLEIGSFQGRSAVWLLANILTHPTSRLTCVDTFAGSVEHNGNQVANMFDLFQHNMVPFVDRVGVIRGSSHDWLHTVQRAPQYHFIYIDGDHRAPEVLEDAVLSFPLLHIGGIMIFDDYGWEHMQDAFMRPQPAIDAFLSVYRRKIRVIHMGYQVVIQKLIH